MDNGTIFIARMLIEDEIDGGPFVEFLRAGKKIRKKVEQGLDTLTDSINEIATNVFSEGGWLGRGTY